MKRTMILCCGEAVIDLIENEAGQVTPVTGGAAVNTAIALARLGQSAGFFGGLSLDAYGQKIRTALDAEGVDVSHAPTFDAPTTQALVHLKDGAPQFEFRDENSAGRALSVLNLPPLDGVTALVLGGLSLIHRPAAGVFETLMQMAAETRLTLLDANIRPALIGAEGDSYRQRLDRMMRIADILKFSDEDIAWLRPDPPEQYLMGRASLVIHTHGADGATIHSRHGAQHLPTAPVKPRDTVGAGDTFNAGLLADLADQNLLAPAALARADHGALLRAAAYGLRAATYSVTRTGANPPTKKDLQ
ncbi:carbohydrate kinase [Shimia sp. SDUM112013]|uniref:carbohydrate kinase family protein n=1 Tax=Shimia sp. SDUM112013 TaxID=3136160 RepID=UPI0032EDA3FB